MTSSGGGNVNEYNCTLDEKSLKKAKEELNEDPKNRMGAVETFRKWILDQPHIKSPTDTEFLLLFLRVRYFAQLEARKLLEEFLSRRSKFGKWFKNLDPADPKVLAVLNDRLAYCLPERDDEGRKILIFTLTNIDLDGERYSVTDYFRALVCVFDYVYLLSEMTCVNGTVLLVDFGGYTLKLHNAFSLEERKDFVQTWQGAYPARIKQMHVYNGGTMLDVIFSALRFVMAEKMQKRLKNHGQVLESVYKDIPMRCLPVEFLPDDYKGPNAGKEKEIIESMKNELLRPEIRNRIKYLSSDQWGIDESRRPKQNELQASFRKLNVD